MSADQLPYEALLAVLCRCENKVGKHGCHVQAQSIIDGLARHGLAITPATNDQEQGR